MLKKGAALAHWHAHRQYHEPHDETHTDTHTGSTMNLTRKHTPRHSHRQDPACGLSVAGVAALLALQASKGVGIGRKVLLQLLTVLPSHHSHGLQ
eukprot:scaffold140924_cov15-Tisochrysis_lutea.AAC.2